MIPALRDKYNADFTEAKYHRFLEDMDKEAGYHIDFRIAETPLFVPKEFSAKVFAATDQILSQVLGVNYLRQSDKAIPSKLRVPNEDKLPTTIAIDLAVCKNDAGELVPQL